MLLGVSAPAFGAALSRARVAAAARSMASEMARLRAEAIASRRSVGMRFAQAGGRRVFAVYADGDGDGIRADDIAAGRDPLLAPPRDLPSTWEGIDFGLLESSIPAVPPGPGVLAPSDDPVRFGSTDTVTFTPWGTSSTGTLYISDARETVFAVVLYGRTGRIRTWRFDRELWLWTR
jgi:Tfp pilus assembly protein FimT